MDAPNTTDWITAIATVVIPIASVVLTHRVTTEHYRAIATMDLLRNIVLHCQQLKHEMLDMFQAKSACQALKSQISINNQQRHKILASPMHLVSQPLKSTLISIDEIEKGLTLQIQIQDDIYYASFRSARQVEAQLNTDLVALTFLLQYKGKRCQEAVNRFLSLFISYEYSTATRDKFDVFQQSIQGRIQAITGEVMKLQKMAMPDDT